jgi:hypothetical protein
VDVEMGEKEEIIIENRQIWTQQNWKIDLGFNLAFNIIGSEGGLWVSEQ